MPKHEAEKLKKESKQDSEKETINLDEIPVSAKQQASEAIFNFINLVEYSPNVIYVTVNEQIIIDKRSDDITYR